ncbi:unnamed protein product [Adineta ricciae]|uniref:Uncharacterized protein n=1 Tax=Adineta ricciae TaxID=249248 RepID=A0A816AGI2_ADIRI|nr:unnamed protein product [Adineta ricciae]
MASSSSTTTTTTASVVTAEPSPQLNQIGKLDDGSDQKNAYHNESDTIRIEAKRDDPSRTAYSVQSRGYERAACRCSSVLYSGSQLHSNLFGGQYRGSSNFARPFDEFLAGPGNSDEHNITDTKQGDNSKS